MKVHVTLPDGSSRQIDTKAGRRSVMEGMRDGGIPIRAECGGAMACASCHVVVDPKWLKKVGKACADEADLLEASMYVEEGSRLSCQIPIKKEFEGLKVTLQLDAFEG